MSSILDALNKLDQEKSQAEPGTDFDYEMDPRAAARELIGAPPSHLRAAKLTPAAMLAGAGLIMAAMIAASVTITLMLTSGEPAPAPAQVAAPPQAIPLAARPAHSEPVPAATQAPQIETPTILVASVPDAAPAIAAAPQVQTTPAPAAAEQAASPIAVVEAPARVEIAAALPEPEPVAEVQDESEMQNPERTTVVEQVPVVSTQAAPVTEDKPVPVVSDIRQLAPLTATIEQRYGSDPVRLNMVSPASASRPYAYAIVNRIKVTVGDRIGNSSLELIAVEGHGIAVEAGSRQYYVPF